MEGTSSELVGGDHNDQTVQPSAEEIRKEKRRQRDNRRKKREQREIESTQRELEKMKADYAKLEKNNAYLRGKLEQLEHDVEQTRETRRRLEQIVEQQNIMINMLQIFTYF
uniref:BZIP domain-containing protein n=1 Tax=Populus trichocarpa TaxID=3694 RepID=A0A3N7FX43_POPTR